MRLALRALWRPRPTNARCRWLVGRLLGRQMPGADGWLAGSCVPRAGSRACWATSEEMCVARRRHKKTVEENLAEQAAHHFCRQGAPKKVAPQRLAMHTIHKTCGGNPGQTSCSSCLQPGSRRTESRTASH